MRRQGQPGIISRALTGFGMFWRVMEIDSTIFQDVESFGEKRGF